MPALKFLTRALFLSVFQLALFTGVQALPKEIIWDDLIPEENSGQAVDYTQVKNSVGRLDLDDFEGDQESFDYYLDYVEQLRSQQSQSGNRLATELDKTEIKLAGYATPLQFDGETITELLFVPFLGACAHVPPPPPNQIIYVEKVRGLTMHNLYDPLYLVGELETTPVTTMVANVGYSIKQARILPYEEEITETRRLIEVTE